MVPQGVHRRPHDHAGRPFVGRAVKIMALVSWPFALPRGMSGLRSVVPRSARSLLIGDRGLGILTRTKKPRRRNASQPALRTALATFSDFVDVFPRSEADHRTDRTDGTDGTYVSPSPHPPFSLSSSTAHQVPGQLQHAHKLALSPQLFLQIRVNDLAFHRARPREIGQPPRRQRPKIS